MANYNLSADLAKNLQVYSEFISNRSAVESPRKLDVPLVWDLYMDTTQPVGTALEAYRQEERPFPQSIFRRPNLRAARRRR